MHISWPHAGAAVLLTHVAAAAIELDVNDPASLRSVAKSITASIIPYYSTTVPGLLLQPYYWWEAGLGLDALVNYWALTGDASYVNMTRDGLLWQAGTDGTFMPANQTTSLGNDDQATWALAAMTAAERGFPASAGDLSWAQIAQNVFDLQVARWDAATCAGGLRWQIFTFNAGYDYKNTLVNGDFTQLAARLARFTGNQTYADWAQRSLEWMQGVGMIADGTVFDGTIPTNNCSSFDHTQWTANYGTVLSATSYMVNLTQGQIWGDATSSIFQKARNTFGTGPANNTLTEVTCQPTHSCDTDQLGFRAILARGLADQLTLTTDAEVANNDTMHSQITAILQASALGAAGQCHVQDNSTTCGQDWTSTTWDGSYGVGQLLSALEIILANLPHPALSSVNSTGTMSGAAGPGTGNATTSSPAATSSQPTNAAAAVTGSMLAVLGSLGLAVLL